MSENEETYVKSDKEIILTEKMQSGTQNHILATIFEKNKGQWLSKREIEKQWVLRWSFRKLDDIKKCIDFEDLIKKSDNVPGDIQRTLRSFYDRYSKFGLEKENKNNENNKNVLYRWNPINESRAKDIIRPTARNIFKKKEELDQFLESKKYKCEICGKSKKDNNTIRMAIDHWRAHSVYNIDDPKIAVLLCEKCNNIHHNYDASSIALKYKDDIHRVKKWVKKEKEIRDNGYPPNTEDLVTQCKIIKTINEYYQSLDGMNMTDDFWEDLL